MSVRLHGFPLHQALPGAISQRPSEIDPTILSQCGTMFAMRLANDVDRGQIMGVASDNLKGLFEMLPVLRTGEAIVVGESVSLPMRILVSPPTMNRWPDSRDPNVAVRGDDTKGFEDEGGWAIRKQPEDYKIVMRQWRAQNPHYEHKNAEPNGGDVNVEPGEMT